MCRFFRKMTVEGIFRKEESMRKMVRERLSPKAAAASRMSSTIM